MDELQGLRTLNSRVTFLESGNTVQEHKDRHSTLRLNKMLEIKKDHVKNQVEDINKIFEDRVVEYNTDARKIRYTMEFVERYVTQYADFIDVPVTGKLKKQICFNLVETYLDKMDKDDVSDMVENYLDAIAGKMKVNVKPPKKPKHVSRPASPVCTEENILKLTDVLKPPPLAPDEEPTLINRLARRMSISSTVSTGSDYNQNEVLHGLKKSKSENFEKNKKGMFRKSRTER